MTRMCYTLTCVFLLVRRQVASWRPCSKKEAPPSHVWTHVKGTALLSIVYWIVCSRALWRWITRVWPRRLNVSAGRRLWKSECLPRGRSRGKTRNMLRKTVLPSRNGRLIVQFPSTYPSLNPITDFNLQNIWIILFFDYSPNNFTMTIFYKYVT